MIMQTHKSIPTIHAPSQKQLHKSKFLVLAPPANEPNVTINLRMFTFVGMHFLRFWSESIFTLLGFFFLNFVRRY